MKEYFQNSRKKIWKIDEARDARIHIQFESLHASHIHLAYIKVDFSIVYRINN